MSVAVKKRISAVSTPVSDLIHELVIAQGDRSNRQLARETGIGESMIRALKSGRLQPGFDTLALLLVWDDRFESIALRAMRNRGQLLRTLTTALNERMRLVKTTPQSTQRSEPTHI